jgi:hypothetical protein
LGEANRYFHKSNHLPSSQDKAKSILNFLKNNPEATGVESTGRFLLIILAGRP